VILGIFLSCISLWLWLNGLALHGKPISELRSITCHMGSHSVTCHSTQVNVPCHNPSHTGRYGTRFTYPRRDGRLSWPWCWFRFTCLQTFTHPGTNHLIATRPGVKPMTSRLQVSILTVTLSSHCYDWYFCCWQNYYIFYGTGREPIVNFSFMTMLCCMISIGLAVGVTIAVGGLLIIQVSISQVALFVSLWPQLKLTQLKCKSNHTVNALIFYTD